MKTKKLLLACSFLLLLFLAGCTKKQDAFLSHVMHWHFPLPRVHAGMLIGNGVQGLMIWGDTSLVVTVGRNGFWDRRGGNEAMATTTYQTVKKLLQANDEAGLLKVFGRDQPVQGIRSALRPHQVGGGDVVLPLPEGWKLVEGQLNLHTATAEVVCHDRHGQSHRITIWQDPFEEVAVVQLPTSWPSPGFQLTPSWDHIDQILTEIGVAPPKRWESDREKGFLQTLPQDEPLAMVVAKEGSSFWVATHVGRDAEEAVAGKMAGFSEKAARQSALQWWKKYWEDVPVLQLPDPALQEIYWYGVYKQGACTPPQGLACTLQGPFNESYQLPPWSADYHFNINEQMIYLPALATNRADHFLPMWEMVKGWIPVMRRNGEHFFQREGALIMPHAVDDRCQVVGSFWTGTIDHGCTAWMAQLAWLHYRYSPNDTLLAEVAWPLLEGAFEGYWAMLEKVPLPGGSFRFSLPVSVSPEFKGSRMDAWGKDASFQLAALHSVAEILPKAATRMGKPLDARWAEVTAHLPPYTAETLSVTHESPEQQRPRIVLWQGQDLVESHRHHSHLAAIYPFVTIDPLSEDHKAIAASSLRHLVKQGPGIWSGWCVPWAAVLQARINQPEAAVNWLHWWKLNFVNEGRGTLHDAAFQGTSLIASKHYDLPEGRKAGEIMQLDAGFGALSAVLELLVQQRRDGIYICPAIHRDWHQPFSFEGIAAEGGFLLSARMANRKVQEVTIEARAEETLRLWHGLGNQWTLNGKPMEGPLLEISVQPDEKLVLKRAGKA